MFRAEGDYTDTTFAEQRYGDFVLGNSLKNLEEGLFIDFAQRVGCSVAEQNLGQFAGYLRMKIDNFTPYQFNEVKGQPFVVAELVAAFNKLIDN